MRHVPWMENDSDRDGMPSSVVRTLGKITNRLTKLQAVGKRNVASQTIMHPEHDLISIHEQAPNLYREAADCLMRVLHGAIERQVDSVQKWGIAFATNNPICSNRSMAEIASMLGCSKASLSYEARRFCTEHGLPPSRYMRSEATSEASRKSRKRHIEHKTHERTRISSRTAN
jgi:hypothetical protein